MLANRLVRLVGPALVAACSSAPATSPSDVPPSSPTTRAEATPSPSSQRPASAEQPPARPAHARSLGIGESFTVDGRVVAIEEIVVESIAASPDDPQSYPAGSGATVIVAIAGERTELTLSSPPHPSQPVGWADGLRVELHDTDGKVASLSMQRVLDHVLASETIRISQGERVRLHDTVDFRFEGHSHKSVMAGQESPLMVDVDYGDGRPYGHTHYLFPPREATWTWQDLRFTLVEYGYDDFMVLKVDRLALEPVVP